MGAGIASLHQMVSKNYTAQYGSTLILMLYSVPTYHITHLVFYLLSDSILPSNKKLKLYGRGKYHTDNGILPLNNGVL